MVTTVTITTVTTVTAIAAMGLTATLSIAATILLIFLLSTKELAAARGSGTSTRVSRFISIGIVPLLLTFSVVLTIQFIQLLS